MAYPIERIWGIIKPRVKRRQPKSIEELKHFLLEQWNSIPTELIKNLCIGYMDKIKRVLELKGARIEPEYFKKREKPPYKWKKAEQIPNKRIVYNLESLKRCKDKEIKKMKSRLKKIKGDYSKKIRRLVKNKD